MIIKKTTLNAQGGGEGEGGSQGESKDKGETMQISGLQTLTRITAEPISADYFDNTANKEPTEEKQKLLRSANELKKDFKNNSIINKYANRLLKVQKETGDNKIKARKLQDIINEIEYDDVTSIKSLEITKEDILVFIGITFMIRLICLMIIDWSLTSNFVVSFLQAYLLYIGIYFIFILLIVVTVNITYNFSLNQLYNSDHGTITSLAGSLYYFYFIPGKMLQSSARIIIHLVFILTLTMLSLFIVKGTNNTEEIISYNYSEKKHIKRQLTNFTLILWIFTSVFAIGFR